MKRFFQLLAGASAISLALAGQGFAHDLRAAIHQALSSNPSLKAADANYRATVYDLIAEEGGYQPEVSLFGNVANEYVDDPNGLSAADNGRAKVSGEIGLRATLPLYDGYRRANQVYAAAARVDQSALQLLDASETMALAVTEQYVNLARQGALLNEVRRHIRRLNQIRSQASDLVDGGRLPASDLVQIEATVFSAQATKADIERRLAETAVNYKAIVGSAPHGAITLPAIVAPSASQQGFVSSAVRNSYRVQSASSSVDIAGFQEGIGASAYQPQINLNAGVSAGSNLDGSSGEESRAFVGVDLNWTLYSGRKVGELSALSERKNQALYERMAVICDVERLAGSAWNAFQIASVRNGVLGSEVRSYTQLVRNYEDEFNSAARSVLDLLIAENRLFNARFEQINNQALLAFSGYNALATQSRLAKHFGVKKSDRLLRQKLTPKGNVEPRVVIKRGKVLFEK
ncbi:MAG: TolC family protein [Rhodobacteraceae bacterium]|nr:TolC family protein [Paracoccaceae bacterium]